MPKFQFSGGGGYSGVRTENTQSAKKCLNFNFIFGGGSILGGGGYSGVRIEEMPKSQFSGGWGLSGLKFQRGALWRIWTQILLFEVTVHKPASQIVSHIRMWRLTRI